MKKFVDLTPKRISQLRKLVTSAPIADETCRQPEILSSDKHKSLGEVGNCNYLIFLFFQLFKAPIEMKESIRSLLIQFLDIVSTDHLLIIDTGGNTLLHYAAMANDRTLVAILLKRSVTIRRNVFDRLPAYYVTDEKFDHSIWSRTTVPIEVAASSLLAVPDDDDTVSIRSLVNLERIGEAVKKNRVTRLKRVYNRTVEGSPLMGLTTADEAPYYFYPTRVVEVKEYEEIDPVLPCDCGDAESDHINQTKIPVESEAHLESEAFPGMVYMGLITVCGYIRNAEWSPFLNLLQQSMVEIDRLLVPSNIRTQCSIAHYHRFQLQKSSRISRFHYMRVI